MKNNNGITLMELLIAISLLTIVIFAGSGIYLSSSNLYESAKELGQSQRNAQITMMHIKKQIKDCASNFRILNNGQAADAGNVVEFRVYSGPKAVEPITVRRYEFRDSNIVFTPNYVRGPLRPVNPDVIVGSHIRDCTFRRGDIDGHSLEIEITAEDNNGNNPYTLAARISAGPTAIPSVYQVGG